MHFISRKHEQCRLYKSSKNGIDNTVIFVILKHCFYIILVMCIKYRVYEVVGLRMH